MQYIDVYEKEGEKRLVAEFSSLSRAKEYFNEKYYTYKISQK